MIFLTAAATFFFFSFPVCFLSYKIQIPSQRVSWGEVWEPVAIVTCEIWDQTGSGAGTSGKGGN